MPVGFKRVLLVKYSSIIASTLVLASAIALAQSELDSAHIFPRKNAQMLASANVAASPASAYMHAIKQNVDLVLVPVSVTDGSQRLVTGLDQSNFLRPGPALDLEPRPSAAEASGNTSKYTNLLK